MSRQENRTLCALTAIMVVYALVLPSVADAQSRTWNGSINSGWSTPGNWSGVNTPDTLAEAAVFNTAAGTVLLDSDFTIGVFNTGVGVNASVTLGGSHTLRIGDASTTGTFQVGINTGTSSVLLAADATLIVGHADNLANMLVGTKTAAGAAVSGNFSPTVGTLELNLNELFVGRHGQSTTNTTATGIMNLSNFTGTLSAFNVNSVHVGYALASPTVGSYPANAFFSIGSGTGTHVMTIGDSITAGTLNVGYGDNAAATFQINNAAVVTLGTADNRGTLAIGQHVRGGAVNPNMTGELRFTGGTFIADTNAILIGTIDFAEGANNGRSTGRFIATGTGLIDLDTHTLEIGRNFDVVRVTDARGVMDFSAFGGTAHIIANVVNLGFSSNGVGGFPAGGTLLLGSGSGLQTLTIGNAVQTGTLNVAIGDNAASYMQIGANSNVTVGDASNRGVINIARHLHGGGINPGMSGTIRVNGGTFTAHVSDFIIAGIDTATVANNITRGGFIGDGAGLIDIDAQHLIVGQNRQGVFANSAFGAFDLSTFTGNAFVSAGTVSIGTSGIAGAAYSAHGVMNIGSGAGSQVMNIGDAATTGVLNIAVGDNSTGTFNLGGNATLVVGHASNRGTFNVGHHNLPAGGIIGNNGRLTATGGMFLATLKEMNIGRVTATRTDAQSVTGVVDLSNASVSIDVTGGTVFVAHDLVDLQSNTFGTLILGAGSLSANAIHVGQNGAGTFSTTNTAVSLHGGDVRLGGYAFTTAQTPRHSQWTMTGGTLSGTINHFLMANIDNYINPANGTHSASFVATGGGLIDLQINTMTLGLNLDNSPQSTAVSSFDLSGFSGMVDIRTGDLFLADTRTTPSAFAANSVMLLGGPVGTQVVSIGDNTHVGTLAVAIGDNGHALLHIGSRASVNVGTDINRGEIYIGRHTNGAAASPGMGGTIHVAGGTFNANVGLFLLGSIDTAVSLPGTSRGEFIGTGAGRIDIDADHLLIARNLQGTQSNNAFGRFDLSAFTGSAMVTAGTITLNQSGSAASAYSAHGFMSVGSGTGMQAVQVGDDTRVGVLNVAFGDNGTGTFLLNDGASLTVGTAANRGVINVARHAHGVGGILGLNGNLTATGGTFGAYLTSLNIAHLDVASTQAIRGTLDLTGATMAGSGINVTGAINIASGTGANAHGLLGVAGGTVSANSLLVGVTGTGTFVSDATLVAIGGSVRIGGVNDFVSVTTASDSLNGMLALNNAASTALTIGSGGSLVIRFVDPSLSFLDTFQLGDQIVFAGLRWFDETHVGALVSMLGLGLMIDDSMLSAEYQRASLMDYIFTQDGYTYIAFTAEGTAEPQPQPQPQPGPGPSTEVPEPASLLVTLLGVTALALRRGRNRRA